MKKGMLILCFTLLIISLSKSSHSGTFYRCIDPQGFEVLTNVTPGPDYKCSNSSYRDPSPQEQRMDAQIQSQERARQQIEENERARSQAQAEVNSRADSIRWQIKEKEGELQNISSRGPDFKGAQYIMRWRAEIDAKRAEIYRLRQELLIR